MSLYEKAADESKKALALDPTLLEAHRARGIVLLNTQNLEEAVQEFQAALAINKNIADLNLYLGVTYKALGQYDLAQEALLASYALNPTDTIALTELSRAYFADGRYAQAGQYAEEALASIPATRACTATWAWCITRTKNTIMPSPPEPGGARRHVRRRHSRWKACRWITGVWKSTTGITASPWHAATAATKRCRSSSPCSPASRTTKSPSTTPPKAWPSASRAWVRPPPSQGQNRRSPKSRAVTETPEP